MLRKYSWLLASLLFFCAVSQKVQAQKATAYLLKEPAGWEFERFTLPPVFAPGFPYKGVEELRFSPGMFRKDSADYFTYAFVAQLDNTVAVSQEDIRNYLMLYYKGLCSSTARDRKLSVDTSKISVSISSNKIAADNKVLYNASVALFGVFADGSPVQLNMEIEVFKNVVTKKTYLFFIASPCKKSDAVWMKLYEIRKGFVLPV